MNIISCLKVAPEGQDIQIANDGSLVLDRSDWKIGEYDLPAIEYGRLLATSIDGAVYSGLSLGDSHLEGTKLRKEILSRGMQDFYAVVDAAADTYDSYQTAVVLAAAINKRGDFDIIFCGTGSADMYSQSVGNQLGALLGVPTLDYVKSVTVDGDKATVVRVVEEGEEVLEVTLPAVFTVTADSNEPKIPGMKDILAASKKKTIQWTLADIGVTVPERATEIVSTLAPQYQERKQDVKEASDEAIAAFAKALKSSL